MTEKGPWSANFFSSYVRVHTHTHTHARTPARTHARTHAHARTHTQTSCSAPVLWCLSVSQSLSDRKRNETNKKTNKDEDATKIDFNPPPPPLPTPSAWLCVSNVAPLPTRPARRRGAEGMEGVVSGFLWRVLWPATGRQSLLTKERVTSNSVKGRRGLCATPLQHSFPQR